MESRAPYTLTPVEESELPVRVMEILRRCSRDRRAITGARIARQLGYRNDRKVRVTIRQLIADGQPIVASVSSPFGYRLIASRDEAEAYLKTLRSRAVKTFERLRDVQRAAEKNFGVPHQPLLLSVGNVEAPDVENGDN